MSPRLFLSPENTYGIVDGDRIVPSIEDRWNTIAGVLEEPRRPESESAWKPIAVRRTPGQDLYGVFLEHAEVGLVQEWTVDLDGRYRYQAQADPSDYATLTRFGEDDLPIDHLERLFTLGYTDQTRRLAVRLLRRDGAGVQVLGLLAIIHTFIGRPGAARAYLRRRTRLSSKPLPSPVLQRVAAWSRPSLYTATQKPILYLVQSEGALSPELENALVTDQSDYLCLTYESRVERREYVFYPKSTWTSGRNRLYELCRRDVCNYEYYVFCDDDIGFANTSLQAGIDEFNSWLLSEKPEIGLASTPWHISWNIYFSETERTTEAGGFDALMNAFRRDVFFDNILLPYIENFDRTTWHASQLCLIYFVQRMYTAKQLNTLQISSEKSRPYPRNPMPFNDIDRLVAMLAGPYPPALPSGEKGELWRKHRRRYFNHRLRDELYTLPLLV